MWRGAVGGGGLSVSLLIVADGKRASFDSMCHIYKTALVQIFGCELNLCLLISLIIPAYFFHRNVLVGVVDLLQNAFCVCQLRTQIGHVSTLFSHRQVINTYFFKMFLKNQKLSCDISQHVIRILFRPCIWYVF